MNDERESLTGLGFRAYPPSVENYSPPIVASQRARSCTLRARLICAEHARNNRAKFPLDRVSTILYILGCQADLTRRILWTPTRNVISKNSAVRWPPIP